MLILTIRTDKPEAEIGLFNNGEKLAYETWQAHRRLAETIHEKIKSLLGSEKCDWHDIEAIAVFKGPGSFTGLRIGISVANALADSFKVPIAATNGKDWISMAAGRLEQGENDQFITPEYGALPHITQPKR